MAKKKHQRVDSLTIHAPDGTARMRLATDPVHNLPFIEFVDDAGIRKFCLGLNPGSSPYLTMYRQDGSAVVGMGVGEGDVPGLAVYHPDGTTAVRMRIHTSGEVEIELIDHGDRVRRFRVADGMQADT